MGLKDVSIIDVRRYSPEPLLPPLNRITVDELNDLEDKGQFTTEQLDILAKRGIVAFVSAGRIMGFNEE